MVHFIKFKVLHNIYQTTRIIVITVDLKTRKWHSCSIKISCTNNSYGKLSRIHVHTWYISFSLKNWPDTKRIFYLTRNELHVEFFLESLFMQKPDVICGQSDEGFDFRTWKLSRSKSFFLKIAETKRLNRASTFMSQIFETSLQLQGA